jgi:hypothetical protein
MTTTVPRNDIFQLTEASAGMKSPRSLPFTDLLVDMRGRQAQGCFGFPKSPYLSILSHGLDGIFGTPGQHSPVGTF